MRGKRGWECESGGGSILPAGDGDLLTAASSFGFLYSLTKQDLSYGGAEYQITITFLEGQSLSKFGSVYMYSDYLYGTGVLFGFKNASVQTRNRSKVSLGGGADSDPDMDEDHQGRRNEGEVPENSVSRRKVSRF